MYVSCCFHLHEGYCLGRMSDHIFTNLGKDLKTRMIRRFNLWNLILVCAAAVLLFAAAPVGSQAAVQAQPSAVVKAAAQILYDNEGIYDSVNPNDNGAVSIGKLQWHGPRALSLLRSIVTQNETQAKSMLGTALYTEIKTTTGASAWSTRKLTTAETAAVKKLLATNESKTQQDALAQKDITDYIEQAQRLGMTNEPALVYFADLANQGGTAAAVRVATSASGYVGSYASVTLNELHMAAICDSVMGKSAYHSRRFRTYIYATELGWDYCLGSDSYIPYTYETANDAGAAWIQRSLNTCMKAGLTISGVYDAQTKTAVSKFQAAKNLEVDGYAGRDTITALIKAVFKNESVAPGNVLPTQPEEPEKPEEPEEPIDPVVPLKKATLKAAKKSYGVNQGSGAILLGVTSNHAQSPITYQSSNPTVASVNSKGNVTVNNPGEAKITASQAKTDTYEKAQLTISIAVYSTTPTDYTVPTGSLYAGKNMQKSHVQWLQAALIVLDGADLTVNGTWDAQMTKIVTNFQAKCGIGADGIAGDQTKTMIRKMLAVRTKKPPVTIKCSAKSNTLRWNRYPNANRIYIYRKQKGGSYIRIKVITDMSQKNYSDTKAKKGTTYYYVVKYVSEYHQVRVLGPSSKGVKGVRK